MIFKNGPCIECGCSVRDHTHARLEYFTVEKETEAYKLLAANLANVKKFSTGQEKQIDFVTK
jgi:hypothetical protein